MQTKRKQKGFTLIELLIVIALIAIIAAVAFVALDPLTRFQDARDARRISDASAILTAIKVDQVDNGGQYVYPITTVINNETYMLSNATTTTGCADYNAFCDTDVTSDSHCLNLTPLVTEGYLAEVPVSPTGANAWSGAFNGYTLTKTGNNITIRACESENTDEIVLKR